MNNLQALETMYKSVHLPYKLVKKDSITTVDTTLPRGAGRIVVGFANDGKDFFDSTFLPQDVKKLALGFKKKVVNRSTEGGQDIETLYDMVADSPFDNGDYFYAETEDGELCAVVYIPNNSDLATIFVCLTATGKFLGVIGADLS